MSKIVPIDSRLHSKLKLNADRTLAFTKSQHIAPIVIHEIAAAAQEFPLMFLKDNSSDKFRLCAIMGLKTGTNLYYSDKGWRGEYVPAVLRAYPFALMEHPEDKNQRILCVDEESDWLNESEGNALFTEDGKRTEFVENLGQFIVDLNQRQEVTEKFVQSLLDNELLVEKTLQIGTPESDKYQINGIYVIDEQKLNNLSDDKFLEFRKNGFVGPIYGILMSMSRVNRLLQLAAESGEKFPTEEKA